MEITKQLIKKIDETLSHGLCRGLGQPILGQMCVEAAICYSLGLPHSDDPKCVNPTIRKLKIVLNDARWSSNTARAKGMRNLAILQLGTNDNFDEKQFVNKIALFTCTDFLPFFLSNEKYEWFTDDLKNNLLNAKSLTPARDAAADTAAAARAAAADAADAYAYAAARAAAARAAAAAAAYAYAAAAYAYADAADAYADAARAAADAADSARAAADAADADLYLNHFTKGVEKILIDMNVPAKNFISCAVPVSDTPETDEAYR